MSVWNQQGTDRVVAPGSWHPALGHQFKAIRFCFHQKRMCSAKGCRGSHMSFWEVRILTPITGLHVGRPLPPSHTHSCAHRPTLAS